MEVLGAVLAGGRSSRFGRDKAEASIDGKTLISRVLAALGAQCDEVCVVGRSHSGRIIPDWPRPDMGPLGGLAGALRYAVTRGFDTVLSSAVDIPDLPRDLIAKLGPAPAFMATLPVVGLWRITDLPSIETLLASDASHSVRSICEAIGARSVTLDVSLSNINTERELEEFARRSLVSQNAARL